MRQVMSDRKRDENSGRFTDKYPPEVVVEAIQTLGGRAATSEVAAQIDSSRDTAYKKLQILEERGDVKSQKVGGIRVWQIPEDGNIDA